MIATVIWNPFDAQFNGLITAMDEHRKFILDELNIYQAQQARDSERAAAIERTRAEKERKKADESREEAHKQATETDEIRKRLDKELLEMSIRNIIEWLEPPRFADALESSQEQREEGTAEWIFENEEFNSWKGSSIEIDEKIKWSTMPPWVLWVHGNPGCGKTILASSVFEEIREKGSCQEQPNQTCYFFFKYDNPHSSNIQQAYRSALAQTLHCNHHDNDLLDKFLFAKYGDPSSTGQHIATSRELHDLMRVCANHLGQFTLVLDGIDEAIQPDSICRDLKELVTTAPV
jgi:hypothetical protein